MKERSEKIPLNFKELEKLFSWRCNKMGFFFIKLTNFCVIYNINYNNYIILTQLLNSGKGSACE
jgi:hypothetical protein